MKRISDSVADELSKSGIKCIVRMEFNIVNFGTLISVYLHLSVGKNIPWIDEGTRIIIFSTDTLFLAFTNRRRWTNNSNKYFISSNRLAYYICLIHFTFVT